MLRNGWGFTFDDEHFEDRNGTEKLSVSLVRDDLFFRAQHAIWLVPRTGLGIAWRALGYALVAWLPIALWVAVAGHAIEGAVDEPLLQHFGVSVRCLIAIPLLVLAEAMARAW